VTAHITRYRSVEDSEEFVIEPDVTCLVGKNESGKTNILQALYRLNPVDESVAPDEVVDFPAWLAQQRRQRPEREMIPMVTATFRYDDKEAARIEKDLGPDALTTPEFTVAAGYRSNSKKFTHHYDEPAIVKWLCSKLNLPADTMACVNDQTTVAALAQILMNREVSTPADAEARRLAERIEGWPNVDDYLTNTYALPLMPKFVYFDEYNLIPTEVHIPNLVRGDRSREPTPGERAVFSLLKMASIEPLEFHQPGRERQIRALENVSNTISDEVYQYWTQNQDLEVRMDFRDEEQVGELQIRVYNRRHRISLPFSEQSRGFMWFFSFFAYFNELEEAQHKLILLLDEPGMSLHGRAQRDLLRLIDERLAPYHQVLYTTHSPFMVSADHFHRVRTVIDRERSGTKVSADIFRADEDTAFPLLTAMGIEISQTLFIGAYTLLVEGPSDIIYLDVLSHLAKSRQQPGLDPRWVKVSVGGSGKLSTFVALLRANKLRVAALIDSSTKDVGTIKRLRGNSHFDMNNLVEVGEFTDNKDADIEDLFEHEFYLKLVNLAYSDHLSEPITLKDINRNDPRIVRAVEQFFAEKNILGGKLDHYRPAEVLWREQFGFLPQIADSTAARAAKLFARLNKLLPDGARQENPGN
jgi:predicted ATP-dependent endonuclease of OLD family